MFMNTNKRLTTTWLMSSLLIINLFIPTMSYAEEQEGDFQWFASIGYVTGIYEGIWIDRNLTDIETKNSFKGFSIELRAQYKGFFFEAPGRGLGAKDGLYTGPGLGYNFFNTETWSFDAYFTEESNSYKRRFANPDQIYEIPKESDQRFGLRATGYYDKFLTQFTFTPVSLRDEIGGVALSASIRRDWQIRNFNIFTSIGAKYRSSDILNYYYGITEEEAVKISEITRYWDTAEQFDKFYAPIKVGAGTSVNFQLGFEYPLTENWVLGGFYSVAKFADSVKNSPSRAGDATSIVSGLSITYVF
jgi:outer membrane protein